jgi:dipeptidyl aminopeptidase/acylaminoacyl peptidase
MIPGKRLESKFEYYGGPSLPRPDLKPPAGWSLPLISAFETVRSHTLSPDGNQIAFIWDREDTSDIYTLSTERGWPRRISVDRGPVVTWDDELPAWSASSRWLAFTQAGHVYVAPVEGGLPVKVTDFTSGASSPIWMPSEDGLIVSVDRYDAVQLILTDRLGAWPRPLTNHASGDAWDAQPSPDGRFVAYLYRPFDDLRRRDIRLICLEDGSIHTISGESGVFTLLPRWHPQGTQLAFLSQKSGFYEIWLADLESGQPIQLSRFGWDIANLAWSPDGKQIACIVNRGGAFELDLLDVQTGSSETLLGGPGYYLHLNWARRGDFITLEYENPFQPPDLYRFDLATRQLTQLTFSHIPAVASLNLVPPQPVTYPSLDGVEVPAFLYRPAHPNRAAVVYLHGGPNDQFVYSWFVYIQYLVAKGYTVLAPNYRGSTGYGVAYERLSHGAWGAGDVQDCLQAYAYLAGLPDIDPQRIACWGPSYGGYLTNCLLAWDPDYRFACGVSVFGDADLLTSWAMGPLRMRLYSEIYLGHPAFNREVYRAGSPIHQAAQVRKPLLLLHGLLDDIVPPEGSEEWAAALRQAGKTYEYKTYANEPHGFLHRSNRLDAFQRIERFLDWYLLPERVNQDE